MKQLGPVELWLEAVWPWLSTHSVRNGATRGIPYGAPEQANNTLPVAQGSDTSMVEDRCKQRLVGGAGSIPAAGAFSGVKCP